MPEPKILSDPQQLDRILLLSPHFLITVTPSQTLNYFDHNLTLLSSLVAYTNVAGSHANHILAFAIVNQESVVLVKKQGDDKVYVERWKGEKRVGSGIEVDKGMTEVSGAMEQ